MTHITIFFRSALVFLALSISSVANAEDCSSSTDAAVILSGNNWAQCEKATADALQVEFYQLALCTSKPTFLDDSACTFILNSTIAVPVDIQVGAVVPLISGDISIPEGTYTHAMLLIDTSLGLKSVFEFDTPQYDGQGNQGNLCWTNGNPIAWGYSNPDYMVMTCGTTPAPEFSIEIFKAFGGDNGGVVSRSLNNDTPDTIYDVYLLRDRVTEAVVSQDIYGYPAGNAEYIWGVQKFKSPPTITANTSAIDMAFKLSEGMGMGFNGYSCDASPACVEGINVNGFQFVVTANQYQLFLRQRRSVNSGASHWTIGHPFRGMKNGDSEGGKTCNQAAGCLNDAVFDGLKFLVKAE